MAQSSHVLHEIHPVFNTDSRILILGSFPSVKSRESQFFYGHPRNRFWDLLATLTGEPLPAGIEEKKSLLLAHHIAVWDVIASCDIEGSSDSSIHNVVPNDLSEILQTASIRQIFTNGGTAYRLYKKILFSTNSAKSNLSAIHKSGKCSLVKETPAYQMESDLSLSRIRTSNPALIAPFKNEVKIF